MRSCSATDEKEKVVDELHAKMAKAESPWRSLQGHRRRGDRDVAQEVPRRAIDYKIVKNTLAQRAAKGTPVEVLAQQFVGPSALIHGYSDVVARRRSCRLLRIARSSTIRSASSRANLVDAAGLKALASMPGYAGIAWEDRWPVIAHRPRAGPALLNTPGSQLARVIRLTQGPARSRNQRVTSTHACTPPFPSGEQTGRRKHVRPECRSRSAELAHRAGGGGAGEDARDQVGRLRGCPRWLAGAALAAGRSAWRRRPSSRSSSPRPATTRSTSSRKSAPSPASGLKEAKDLVEGAPKTVRKAPTRRTRRVQELLEAAGATVELK